MDFTVAVLQQSDGTPPGSVIDWIRARGHRCDLRKLQHGDSAPGLNEFDLAIILGGSMNVDDLDVHPWLAAEKTWLKQAIEAGKVCLGICLGGQLIAQVLGGGVRQHAHWEVGWHPVTFTDGRTITVFQFHQDTFDLPPGARLWAGNQITANQAFTIGDRIVGLQFHPEASSDWVNECADENPYPTGPYVQTPSQLREGVRQIPQMQAWFFELLDRMAATAKA